MCAGSFYDLLCALPGRCDSYSVCFKYEEEDGKHSHWAYPDTCEYDSGTDDDGEEYEGVDICFGDGNFSTVDELREMLYSLTEEYGDDMDLSICLDEDNDGDWHDLLNDDPHIDHRHRRVTYYVE